mgnify:CR=1 FL=1
MQAVVESFSALGEHVDEEPFVETARFAVVKFVNHSDAEKARLAMEGALPCAGEKGAPVAAVPLELMIACWYCGGAPMTGVPCMHACCMHAEE